MSGDLRVSSVELLGALSLATDLGTGQPIEHGMRTCALATELGRAAGLAGAALTDVYLTALLHSIGCTSDAFEAAALYGDDIEVRAAYTTVDGARPQDVLRFLAGHVGSDRPPLRRAGLLARTIAAGPSTARAGFAAHCEVGQRLAGRLGLPQGTHEALGFVFERWDGKGYPNGARGSEIPAPARTLHVARDTIALARRDGTAAALTTIVARRGGAYEPVLVDALSEELIATASDTSWEAVRALDCAPAGTVHGEALDESLAAIADFGDIKSPWTLGHSRRVAELAEAAAWRLSLGRGEVEETRSAAWVHDLGRVAISNAIWDKRGPLTSAEWERVRLHPYFTERALSRTPALDAVARIAAAHHERVDGGGYQRAIDASREPMPARLVAAADAYVAMTADRPHRPALDPDAAAAQLRAGALDAEAAEAVLAAAGHRAVPVSRERPAGLSEREVEVLRLLARGHSNKEIAHRLGISPKTAGHHVGHIYAKIGVSTRAAAALFAVEHGLLGR